MLDSPQTILVAAFHSYISRNILNTDFLEILRQAPDLRVVLVVPKYKLDFFKKTYERGNVIVEGVNPGQTSKQFLGLFFKRFAELSHVSETTRIKRRYKFYHERKISYFLIASAIAFFGSFFLVRKIIRFLDLHLSPRGMFGGLFAQHRPRIVFSTDTFNENDVALMMEARRGGVSTVGMVRSWDNPSKYTLRIFPDRIVVGTETLKEELREFHHYPEARIFVSGYPHYDRYDKGPTISREEFFKSFGLDPAKKLIFFSPVGDDLIYKNDFDQYVMDILGEIKEQVLVRYPPASAVYTAPGWPRPKNLAFDIPGVTFNKDIFTDREITDQEDERLLNILYYSDVVITGPTSIPLDASYFDKPVIVADLYPTSRPRFDSIYEYEYFHFKKLLRLAGGVTHVRTKAELLSAIRRYLTDSKLDSDGRRRIRKLWFSVNDGRAGERLGKFILSLVP